MRILLYNWVPFDDAEKRSGGVRVYQANLVAYLCRNTDIEVYTLSSGVDHSILATHPRIVATRNTHGKAVRSFSLINSTVLAPGHMCFGNIHLFEKDSTYQTFSQFLAEHGPFDVVHFDSLEGLPLACLEAPAAIDPRTRVTLYAHNYYLVCPQVNLWKSERKACTDYHDGRDCISCIPHLPDPVEVLNAYKLSWVLRRLRIKPKSRPYRLAYHVHATVQRSLLLNFALKRALRLLGSRRKSSSDSAVKTTKTGSLPKLAPLFVKRRHGATKLVAENVDTVIATSHRVRDVLAHYGVDPDHIEVSYIGTAMAERAPEIERRDDVLVPGQLTLAYLGYLRRDKGFHFLLSALDDMPATMLAKLRLVIAAPLDDDWAYDQIRQLRESMVEVVVFDRYTHDELPDILATVDVGLVPVQWEDNLPQVAIEMVSQGIPIITTDLGGSKELGGTNPDFVFRANDAVSFLTVVNRLLKGEVRPGDYWKQAIELQTMAGHVDELLAIWNRPRVSA